MEDINLHINKVVLDGFDLQAVHREALHAALVETLTGMLARGGLNRSPVSSGSVYRIPVPQMGPTNPAKPGEMGRQIAGAVYAGLNPAGQERE